MRSSVLLLLAQKCICPPDSMLPMKLVLDDEQPQSGADDAGDGELVDCLSDQSEIGRQVQVIVTIRGNRVQRVIKRPLLFR